MATPMNRTILHPQHVALGAKIVPFSGWEMPLSYAGVTDEHKTVRTRVGLFDISHMGRFELSGKGADDELDRITPGPVRRLQRGGAQYSMLLNETGGILDDIYIYKRGMDRYTLIVNAANRAKDFAWMSAQLQGGVSLSDVSDETALLAVQGPRSWEVMAQVIPFGKTEIPLRSFIETELLVARGAKALVARTGYTGEKGYEIILPVAHAAAFWTALMEAGKEIGIRPIGLGARDTLRLEMGYLLYGHDMNAETTPLVCGLGAFIDLEKSFIGKEALVQQKQQGLTEKLVGFELPNGGIPREGCRIYSEQKEIGRVTSGNFSPTLRRGIGMGYVVTRYGDEGGEILLDIRGKAAEAVIVKRPFYKKKKL
jgi:aminomethyltransferase